jgi:hypothetical protein
MNVEDIRTAVRQSPFVPFAVRLADGRALLVKHPEFVVVTRRNLIVVDPDTDDITWVDPMLALSLDFAPGGAAAASGSPPSNGPPPPAPSP